MRHNNTKKPPSTTNDDLVLEEAVRLAEKERMALRGAHLFQLLSTGGALAAITATLAACKRGPELLALADGPTRRSLVTCAAHFDRADALPAILAAVDRPAPAVLPLEDGNRMDAIQTASAAGADRFLQLCHSLGQAFSGAWAVESSPLWLAASAGKEGTVKLLAQHGAQLESPGGTSPLFFAALTSHVAAARLLLAHGADPDAAHAESGLTPLLVAVMQRNLEMARCLVRQGGADPDKLRPNGQDSPLTLAISKGWLDMAQVLVDELGARADLVLPDGSTAFSRALAAGNGPAVALLVGKTSPAEADLEAAAASGLDAILGTLLQATSHPATGALHAAAAAGQTNCVRVLLGVAGASRVRVNEPSAATGRTALSSAAAGGHSDIIRLLLAVGADPNIPSIQNPAFTPCYMAVLGGHVQTLALLLEMGKAKPDWQDLASLAKKLEKPSMIDYIHALHPELGLKQPKASAPKKTHQPPPQQQQPQPQQPQQQPQQPQQPPKPAKAKKKPAEPAPPMVDVDAIFAVLARVRGPLSWLYQRLEAFAMAPPMLPSVPLVDDLRVALLALVALALLRFVLRLDLLVGFAWDWLSPLITPWLSFAFPRDDSFIGLPILGLPLLSILIYGYTWVWDKVETSSQHDDDEDDHDHDDFE